MSAVMDSLTSKGKIFPIFLIAVALALLSFSPSLAQKGKNGKGGGGSGSEDVDLTVDCIKYLGNGKFSASFGYNNKGKKEVNIPDTDSNVHFESGKPGKKGLNNFQKGRVYNAMEIEFDNTDRVTWLAILPNGKEKVISANINSFTSHCSDADNGLIPLFDGNEEGGVIWPELFYLSENPDAGNEAVFQIQEDLVLVEIYATEDIESILVSEGFTLQEFEEPFTYIGFFPIARLQEFNTNTAYDGKVNFVRPVYPPFNGAITTEGDAALKANIARDAYLLDGTGIKVGVLSDSYNQNGKAEASKDIQDGELPATGVELVPDANTADPPFRGIDEGRAMLQIVHDVAPGAELAFRTGFNNARDFALGITQLADANCDVIVDDITYITEPFYRDGKVAQAVKQVTENGAIYVTSAGNFGNNSVEGSWNGTDPSQTYSFLRNPTDQVHNYGTSELQRITLDPITNSDGTTSPATVLIVLQWDDEFFSLSSTTESLESSSNLDIWIVDDSGNLLYSGNRDNNGEDPIEVLAFQVTQPLSANILLSGSSSTGPVVQGLEWKYIVYRGAARTTNGAASGLGYIDPIGNLQSTVTGHANAKEAITVGAAEANFTTSPILEPFSSLGGTKVLEGGGLVARSKPDIVGPDGVSTTVFDLQTFFGTSAAAPHIAGAAALVAQAKKDFYPSDPALSTADLKGIFQQPGATIDMEAPNFDLNSGFGFFVLDGALANLANPTPQLLGIITQRPPTSPNAGEPADQETAATEGVELVVTAQYLTENVVVLYNGAELNTNINPIAGEDDKYSIIIPPFIGNPTIELQNPPLLNGLDGGTSQTLNIFDNVIPIVVNVIPQGPATKYFGETSSAFNCTVCTPTTTPNQYDISDQVPFNLPPLTFITPEDFDPAGVYSVKPAFVSSTGVLIQESDADFPNNLIEEIALLNSLEASTFTDVYQIDLENLRFDILQLPLTIRMKDQSILYGANIPIEFEFSFLDSQGNEIPHNNKTATVNEIALNYSISYLNPDDPGEIYGIINRGRALRNDEQAISNRGRALRNGEEPLTLLEGVSFVATLSVLSDGTIDPLSNRGRALRNRGRALRNRGRALRNDYIYDLDQTHIFNYFGIQSPEGFTYEGSEMFDETVIPEYTANRGRALRNQEEFLNTGTTFSNRGRALRNSTPLVNSAEFSYGEMIVIIDESEVAGEGPDGEVNQYYAIAMVSGVDVTEVDANGNPVPGKENKIIPGGFIDVEYEDPNIDFSSNFDISYANGNLTVSPGNLTPTVNLSDTDQDKTIIYGEELPAISSIYEGFQYDEFEAVVFEPVTYELVDISNDTKRFDPSDLSKYPDAGTYRVVADYNFKEDLPVNYILDPQNDIFLTITPATLIPTVTIQDDDNSIVYGEDIPEIITSFIGFKFGETNDQVLSENYLLEKDGVSSPDYTEVGAYTIVPEYTFLDGQPQNYQIDMNLFEAPVLNVTPGLLTVNISYLDGSSSKTIEYSDPYPEIQSQFEGFVRGESELDVISSTTYLINGIAVSSVGDLDVDIYQVTAEYQVSQNYTLSGPQPLELIIVEKPVIITFDPENPTQPFGDTGDVGFSTDFEVVTTVTYLDLLDNTTSSEYPINAGTYLVTVTCVSPNFTGSVQTTLTIEPAIVEITFDNVTPVYDNTLKEIGYTLNSIVDIPEDINIIVKYNGSLEPPTNAGTYDVTVEIDERNFVTPEGNTVIAQFEITPATLTLKADEKITKQGIEPDYGGSVVGFVGEDSFESVFGNESITYSLQVSLNNPGFFPGAIIPSLPGAQNYIFETIPGDLYINPSGSGVKKIRNYLDCVQRTGLSDYPFVANFRYENTNASSIYIPFTDLEQSDNYLIAEGNYELHSAPIFEFVPGGGVFRIKFDGQKLIWVVSSEESAHKTSVSSDASSSSNKCKNKDGYDAVNLSVHLDDLTGYPNPVVDKFSIILNDMGVDRTEIMLLNRDGKTMDLKYTYNPSIKGIEIDMNGFKTGMYIIRIYNDEIDQVFNVFKK